MFDFPTVLVGLAALLAVVIVLLAEDWRDAQRDKKLDKNREGSKPRMNVRDGWPRQRH